MPRKPRELSEPNLYHVMARGVGRQAIFENDDDYQMFYRMLAGLVGRTLGELYSWCLMENHVHLLFHMELDNISYLMRSLETGYALRFNAIHGHVGHLFQNRYASVPIKDERQLLSVVKYIHRNPVVGGLASDCGSYRWSSFHEYMGKLGISQTDWMKEHFAGKDDFAEYCNSSAEDENAGVEFEPRTKIGDATARQILIANIGADAGEKIRAMKKPQRDQELSKLKRTGLSTRQIERLTGLGRNIIQRVK